MTQLQADVEKIRQLASTPEADRFEGKFGHLTEDGHVLDRGQEFRGLLDLEKIQFVQARGDTELYNVSTSLGENHYITYLLLRTWGTYLFTLGQSERCADLRRKALKGRLSEIGREQIDTAESM